MQRDLCALRRIMPYLVNGGRLYSAVELHCGVDARALETVTVNQTNRVKPFVLVT